MFKILSLDGGGIRGAFIAALLAKLQESLDQPINKYFDLITGTSTGGLIAVALGMGMSAARIKALYQAGGPAIFTRPPPRLSKIFRGGLDAILRKYKISVDTEWLYQSKYRSDILKKILEEQLGDRPFGDARSRLVVPSVDLSAAKIIVFKTPHRPHFTRDRHFRAVDVIMATTAAPSYFPSASIEAGSSYCDGGIWANNPALVGYVEAIRIAAECRRPAIDELFAEQDVHMLSIGTGRAAYFVSPDAGEAGLKWWAPRLLNISSEAQSEGIHWQMKYLLGERYFRIDFDIPSGDWALDAVQNIDALIHFGSERATEQLPNLRKTFFAQVSTPYQPFNA